MNTAKTYKTSYKVKFQGLGIGWINSDPGLDLAKLIKGITEDFSDQKNDLLEGKIDEIDFDSPLKSFHVSGATDGKTRPEFFGFLRTESATKTEILHKLWDRITVEEIGITTKKAA